MSLRTHQPDGITKPLWGAKLDFEHAQAQDLLLATIFPEEGNPKQIVDDVNNRVGAVTGSAWNANNNGPVHSFTAITDLITWETDTVLNLPTTEITIILRQKKRDATNRGSTVFTAVAAGVTAARLQFHAPFSDGVVYWDFGGATAGTTRVSVSGLTFGDDTWAVTVGPRGMEIWQSNAAGLMIKRASNSATPTHTNGGLAFCFGGNASTSDLVDKSYIYMYRKQLREDMIQQIASQPYAMYMQSSVQRFYSIAAVVSTRVIPNILRQESQVPMFVCQW